MSRWHRDNPELYEAGYDPMEEALAAADYARKAEREGAMGLSGPSCHVCGSATQPTGGCHTCPRCGETTGCG